jgi:hypothetical protein
MRRSPSGKTGPAESWRFMLDPKNTAKKQKRLDETVKAPTVFGNSTKPRDLAGILLPR